MAEKSYEFDTQALHAGFSSDATTGASVVPIYQTASYVFQDTASAARLFSLEESGNIYTRLQNPTTDVLEKRVAALENGVAGVAFSSGMAAISAALLTLCGPGDEIVASTRLYGGTVSALEGFFRHLGIVTRWVDSDDAAAFRSELNDRTRAVYLETIGNPRLTVPDIAGITDVAHRVGVPVVVDNTTASPALCRPIEFGADIVVHSLTKYINGHGNSIGGMVVDGGRFSWDSGRFPQFSGPDPAYHGLCFSEHFGKAAFAARCRCGALHDQGGCISPFNSFLTLTGMETLGLRMARHCENALAVARFLEAHPLVTWVLYPGLESHPSYAYAQRYLAQGASGMVGFGVRGGSANGGRFIEALELFSHLANIGDSRSLAIHPATTTHSQLSESQLAAAGVTPDFIRLSIGIESVNDIIGDLDQALEASV